MNSRWEGGLRTDVKGIDYFRTFCSAPLCFIDKFSLGISRTSEPDVSSCGSLSLSLSLSLSQSACIPSADQMTSQLEAEEAPLECATSHRMMSKI